MNLCFSLLGAVRGQASPLVLSSHFSQEGDQSILLLFREAFRHALAPPGKGRS